jgi:hypothetical protein
MALVDGRPSLCARNIPVYPYTFVRVVADDGQVVTVVRSQARKQNAASVYRYIMHKIVTERVARPGRGLRQVCKGTPCQGGCGECLRVL